MTQYQATISGEIDINHFDIGVDETHVILLRQFAADASVTPAIMDRIDPDAGAFFGIVVQMEKAEGTHQPRAQELPDEAFVTIIGPDAAQHRDRIALARDIREPLTVLFVGI